MIKIEIFKEDERVETRTSRAKDDKPARTFYEQDAYAHLGGKFPSLIKVSLERINRHMQPDYIHFIALAMLLITLGLWS